MTTRTAELVPGAENVNQGNFLTFPLQVIGYPQTEYSRSNDDDVRRTGCRSGSIR